jgi:hypothetical protein
MIWVEIVGFTFVGALLVGAVFTWIARKDP